MNFCYCDIFITKSVISVKRQATLIAPLVTFEYMDHWLRMVLSKAALQPHNTHGNVHDPVYLEWEALSQVIVDIYSKILICTLLSYYNLCCSCWKVSSLEF